MLSWGRKLAVPGALLALCVGFYWKLALTDQYVWFDHPDMCYIEIPRLQFQANEIHRGQFPLWDPRIWAGQPLIGQTQPGPLYPFNLAFALLPLTDGYIRLPHLNWYFVFIHFQAALFCFWLARDLGRSFIASVIAGCLFSFGGFIGSVAWLDVMNGAVWTPLVFLFLFRALRGQSPAASATLGGFFLGIAWLCGHHEIPMLVSYLAVFTWLFHILCKGERRPDWQLAKLAGIFFLAVFLTSAVQTLPTFEFGRISQRWLGLEQTVGWKDPMPYVAHTTYSMPVRGILGLALFGVNHADSSTFIGITGLGLAALGLIAGWANPVVRWLGIVFAGTLIYSLGAATPFHGILYSLAPMLSKARVTVRAVHLVHFGIAMLAAYGVDFLADRESALARRITWIWAGFGLLIVGAATAMAVAGHPDLDEKVMLSGWVALALAAVVFAYRSGKITTHWVFGGILALILVELASLQNYSSRFDKNRNQFVNSLRDNRDIATFLKMQPGPVRVAVNDQDVPTNFGDIAGVDMLQGYVAGVSENVLRHGLHTPETRRLFAVTYWMSREPERPDQVEVFKGASGVKVFRNPGAMPRAWAAHEAVRVRNNYELQVMIHDPNFDPRRTVAFLDFEPPRFDAAGCDSSGDEEVKILRHHSNRITLRADMRCSGVVVVADSYFDGWRATVDGAPVPILETYGALRGVVVPKGGHDIEMRYQPVSVLGGGVLTLCGVILAGVAWRRR